MSMTRLLVDSSHDLEGGERIAQPPPRWRRSRIARTTAAISMAHESSAIGYSHTVVSGGPIAGSMRYHVSFSVP
jgi:hypothetical protein